MNRLLTLLALLLVGCSATAEPGLRVLSIGDGDTITVSDGTSKTKVRLACIDAPETSQRPVGPAARQALQQLLPVGTPVTLEVKATDRYGRTVGEVLSGGRNVNQAMVGSGAAFVYWQYITGCDRARYGSLEANAKALRLGVWAQPMTPPWEYRSCRRSGQCR